MRNLLFLSAMSFLVLTLQPSYAAWVTTELETPATSVPRISMQFLSSQYLTNPSLSTQANTYQYVIPRLYSASPEKSGFVHEVDFNAVLPVSEAGESHYFFPNLYAGLVDRGRKLSVHFGRKKSDWSDLDEQMNLGLWQPLFRWDHARPVSMGLTGFHFQSIQGVLRLNAAVSPFFLPDQQSAFEVKDGEIISGNRWFRRPIHSIEGIGNTSSDVVYNVNEPTVEDVVLNETYALAARLGKERGPYAKLAWTNKPMNQFHLGIDLEESLLLNNDLDFQANVHPLVVRHELRTLEAGYIEKDFKGFLSFTTERIKAPRWSSEFDEELFEETDLIDANYLGLGFQHQAALPWIPNSQLIWTFAKRDELPEGDEVLRIEGNLDASTQRFPFEEWMSLEWRAKKEFSKWNFLSSSITYHYSPSDDGEWLALNLTYNTSKSWQWYVSGDIFGAGEIEDNAEWSFISIYRNNDRVQGGFVYVF